MNLVLVREDNTDQMLAATYDLVDLGLAWEHRAKAPGAVAELEHDRRFRELAREARIMATTYDTITKGRTTKARRRRGRTCGGTRVALHPDVRRRGAVDDLRA